MDLLRSILSALATYASDPAVALGCGFLGAAVGIAGLFGWRRMLAILILLLAVWLIVLVVIRETPTPMFIGLAVLSAVWLVLLGGAAVRYQSPQHTVVTRTAFDETQSIKVLPPSLGGNHVLKLGNLATLRLHAPYSLGMTTLVLDAAPITLPDHRDETMAIEGLAITKGSRTAYTFDTTKNKRHEINVAGRTYIVTLMESKRLDVPGVGNPIEYVFGITEK